VLFLEWAVHACPAFAGDGSTPSCSGTA
jgi:hypothetical protein